MTKTVGTEGTAPAADIQGLIWHELDVLVSEPPISGSSRLKRFLNYIITETLDGRGDRLNGYTIALDVFDKPEDFDPAIDSIVRVEASRLRRRLIQHYAEATRSPFVKITLPRGSYVPLFEEPASEPSPPAAAAAAQPKRGPSIAVLPFENFSGNPDDQCFADGLTEETIANLARFKELFVFSRSTTTKLVQEGADIRQLHKELGVNFVLEGSLRKTPQAVRVTAQLIDATTNGHIFAEQLDRPCTPEGIFEIQDEIAQRVAGRIADGFGPLGRYLARAKRDGQSQHWDTYRWITRFYEYYATADPAIHLEIRDGLPKALERDPNSSDGWAALSIVLVNEFTFHLNERPDHPALDEALQCALQAVYMDPENAFAYQALAQARFHNQEFDEFKIAADRALALNPGHSGVLADIGFCYAMHGDWDYGLQLMNRALELSPVHPGWYHMVPAAHLLVQKDPAAALVELKKGTMPGFYWFHVMMVCALSALGDAEQAKVEWDEVVSIYPDFAANFHRELQIWNMSDEVAQMFEDGLSAAGLEIS